MTPRPTMDEMRERDKDAKKAQEAEEEAGKPKRWIVEVAARYTFRGEVEVEAVDEEEACAIALEESDCWDFGDYDEAEECEKELRARRSR